MVRPEAPDWFSWIVSSILHLEILVYAALVIGEEVDTPVDVAPIVYDSVVLQRPRPSLRVEWRPAWSDHWSWDCEHKDLIRLARKWPDEVLPGTLCRVC